ncbi:MAG TPA: hypothetical protein VI072_04325 [Polyangiaceae bacterium]
MFAGTGLLAVGAASWLSNGVRKPARALTRGRRDDPGLNARGDYSAAGSSAQRQRAAVRGLIERVRPVDSATGLHGRLPAHQRQLPAGRDDERRGCQLRSADRFVPGEMPRLTAHGAAQNDASTPMLGIVTGPMLSDEQP